MWFFNVQCLRSCRFNMKIRSKLSIVACTLTIVIAGGCGSVQSSTAPPSILGTTPSPTGVPEQSQTTTATTIATAATVVITSTVATLPVSVPDTTPLAAATFGDLISPGRLYYANYCMGCHGADGQGQNGPPLWQPAGTLGKRDNAVFFDNNAQAMLDFISSFMPIGWASLSPVQYMDITAFLLVQDGRVSPFDVFDKTRLKDIMIRQ